MLLRRSPSDVRPSSQKDASTAGPIPSAKTSVPIPAVPPSAKPTSERRELERGPGSADADPEALRDDEHQRVARPCAHRGADVERRADAEERQRDRRAARSADASPCSDSSVIRSMWASTIRNEPIRSAFRNVPSPMCARSAQESTSTATETTDWPRRTRCRAAPRAPGAARPRAASRAPTRGSRRSRSAQRKSPTTRNASRAAKPPYRAGGARMA